MCVSYSVDIMFRLSKTPGSFHIKSAQKRGISNLNPSELNVFCEIVVPMEISIRTKFYCFMATRFLTADIQSCQKMRFFGTSSLRKVA
jgi:hypothetical protein